MKHRLIMGAMALACALFAGPVLAQQYPGVAQSTLGQNRDVTPTHDIPSANPVISFRQTCTSSAAALTDTGTVRTFANGFVVTALSTNAGTIDIGGSNTDASAHGYPLVAGQSISYGAGSSNQGYIICASTNTTDQVAVTGN